MSAVLFVLSLQLSCSLVLAATVTISELPTYESLRPCAQSCFFAGVYDRVANVVGCTTDPDPENSCYCRGDLQSKATKFLEDCVDESCGKDVDVSAALGIYNAYCTSNGYKLASSASDLTPTSVSTSAGMFLCLLHMT